MKKDKVTLIAQNDKPMFYAGKPMKKGDSITVTEAESKVLVLHGFKKEGED